MSQTELARRAGVDRSHLNRLMGGSSNVSVGFLVKLADALNAPLAAFFEGLDEASPEEILEQVESRRRMKRPAVKEPDANVDSGSKPAASPKDSMSSVSLKDSKPRTFQDLLHWLDGR